MAEQVAQLQDPVTQFMALDLPQDNRQARFESDYLLNRAWNQIWLRTGVLEFGYQLLSSQAYGLRYTAMEEWLLATPPVESLASGDPTALIRLGHLALYGYLLDEYAEGRPAILPDEQGYIRFEIPEQKTDDA